MKKRALTAEKRALRNDKHAMGKPKRPLSSFILYLSEKMKNTHSKLSSVADDWANMSDDQKQVYELRAKQLRDAYE